MNDGTVRRSIQEQDGGKDVAAGGAPESADAAALAKEIGVSAQTLERWREDAQSRPARGRAWTDEGWLYLAVVLDLFNREVVGWSIKPRMTADIVIDALTMAWFRKKPAPGLIHHSDRGSQYASHAFQARLEEYGMVCSMSRKGICWDNAPTESFFNSLKNERVHGTRYSTRGAAEADLFDYIEPFYNRRRKHSTLGYASPKKFLEHWISTQHEQQLAA